MAQIGTSERLRQLGVMVRLARESVAMSTRDAAKAAQMSQVTWLRVEHGEPVRSLTYRGIEAVLGWRRGSIDAFMRDGTSPVPVVDRARAEESARQLRAEAIAKDIETVLDDPQLSEADRLELAELIMKAWQEDEEATRRARPGRARTIIDAWRRARGA